MLDLVKVKKKWGTLDLGGTFLNLIHQNVFVYFLPSLMGAQTKCIWKPLGEPDNLAMSWDLILIQLFVVENFKTK